MDKFRKALVLALDIYLIYSLIDASMDQKLSNRVKAERKRQLKRWEDYKDFKKEKNTMLFEAYMVLQSETEKENDE